MTLSEALPSHRALLATPRCSTRLPSRIRIVVQEDSKVGSGSDSNGVGRGIWIHLSYSHALHFTTTHTCGGCQQCAWATTAPVFRSLTINILHLISCDSQSLSHISPSKWLTGTVSSFLHGSVLSYISASLCFQMLRGSVALQLQRRAQRACDILDQTMVSHIIAESFLLCYGLEY